MSAARPLAVAGAWEFTPTVRADERGSFAEVYAGVPFAEAVGGAFPLAQMNVSLSRRGTLRGLHYSVVPGGQAKYVTCTAGAVLDVVVDLRLGSDAFGTHDALRLDDQLRNAAYLPAGLGHAFLALTGTATVAYLCSSPYSPEHEFAITPFDAELALPWPAEAAPYVLSPRDAEAPTLAEARAAGRLPRI
ncbi:MAG TPA: dTDP-4-dehydrorhamnose 3,5-epimerase family protein [Actinomycetes bacterium]|nr:dTDP-4-dehydrorhamnose 3,5-epimerase family protein [Actinomycetes bacterium]